MSGIPVSERTVKIIVITLSIAGVLGLVVLAQWSETPQVNISELQDHEGETVRSYGLVIGQDLLSSGASRLLLVDGNGTAEIYIERSSNEYPSGTNIKVKGEVFSSDGSFSITVQSDSGVQKIGEMEETAFGRDSIAGSIVTFQGNLVSKDSGGWNDEECIIMVEGDDGPLFVDVTISRVDEEFHNGDLISFFGYLWEGGDVLCYGDSSVELIYRPESATSSLVALIDRLKDDQNDIPAGKMNIRSYVKYEPVSKSLYISDEVEGSAISVKVILPDPDPLIHKGDLIELINTTILWDPQSLRYEFHAEWASVILPYGPWRLGLDNLDFGVSSYENTEVILTGEPVLTGDGKFLNNGNSRIELRSIDTIPMGRDIELRGYIRFDPMTNSFYLEVMEVNG